MEQAAFNRLLHGNRAEQALIWDGGMRKPDGGFDIMGEIKSWLGGDKGTALWHSRIGKGGEAARLTDLAKGLEAGTIQIADNGAVNFIREVPQAAEGVMEIADDVITAAGEGATVTTAAKELMDKAQGGGLNWILSPQGVGQAMPPSSQLGQAFQIIDKPVVAEVPELANALQQQLASIMNAPAAERLHVGAVAATALGMDPGETLIRGIMTTVADKGVVFEALNLGIDDLQKTAQAAAEVAGGAAQIANGLEKAPEIVAAATNLVQHAAPIADHTAQIVGAFAKNTHAEAKIVASIVEAFTKNQEVMRGTITDLTKVVTKLAESKL